MLAAQNATYTGTNTTQADINCSYNNVFAMTDQQIAGIASLPASHTIKLYNATNTPLLLATYTQNVLALPLTSAQLTASIFPTHITSSPSLLAAAATGSPVNISWTAPTAGFEYASSLDVFIGSSGQGGGSNLSLNLTPTQTQQLVTPQVTPNAVNSGATVEYTDASFRTIWASPGSPL